MGLESFPHSARRMELLLRLRPTCDNEFGAMGNLFMSPHFIAAFLVAKAGRFT
jgi:hypothetical protein